MRITDIEVRVFQIVEQLKRGQQIEDDRVELKREWILGNKAARRLAGHANTVRGEPILWIFGIDEKARVVVDLDLLEVSNWFAQVKSQFVQDVYPDIIRHANVIVDDKQLIAIAFDTERAPYLVKNEKGGEITCDVPIRKGVSTYSANRSQLLSILAPVHRQPIIDFIRADASASEAPLSPGAAKLGEWAWLFSAKFYVSPQSSSRVVLPFHQMRWTLEVNGETVSELGFENNKVSTVEVTTSEVIIDKPGMVDLILACKTLAEPVAAEEIILRYDILPFGGVIPLLGHVTLTRWEDTKSTFHKGQYPNFGCSSGH